MADKPYINFPSPIISQDISEDILATINRERIMPNAADLSDIAEDMMNGLEFIRDHAQRAAKIIRDSDPLLKMDAEKLMLGIAADAELFLKLGRKT